MAGKGAGASCLTGIQAGQCIIDGMLHLMMRLQRLVVHFMEHPVRFSLRCASRDHEGQQRACMHVMAALLQPWLTLNSSELGECCAGGALGPLRPDQLFGHAAEHRKPVHVDAAEHRIQCQACPCPRL